MNKYELLYIISPDLSEEQIKEAREAIEKNFVSVENTDVWGLKPLAYPINRYNDGYYVLITGTIDKKGLEEIQYLTKINKHYMRHMLINTEKDY